MYWNAINKSWITITLLFNSHVLVIIFQHLSTEINNSQWKTQQHDQHDNSHVLVIIFQHLLSTEINNSQWKTQHDLNMKYKIFYTYQCTYTNIDKPLITIAGLFNSHVLVVNFQHFLVLGINFQCFLCTRINNSLWLTLQHDLKLKYSVFYADQYMPISIN